MPLFRALSRLIAICSSTVLTQFSLLVKKAHEPIQDDFNLILDELYNTRRSKQSIGDDSGEADVLGAGNP